MAKLLWISPEGVAYSANDLDELCEVVFMGGFNHASAATNSKSRVIEIETRDHLINELLRNPAFTYDQIGYAFGLTRERVRQIMTPEIAELRKTLKANNVDIRRLRQRWEWVQKHQVKECFICERRFLGLKASGNEEQRFCGQDCRQLWQVFFRYYERWPEHQVANAKTTIKRVNDNPHLLNDYNWRARFNMSKKTLEEFERTGTVVRKRKIRVNVPVKAAARAARIGILDLRAHLVYLAKKHGWALEPEDLKLPSAAEDVVLPERRDYR